ncbi:cysteine synthase family protein [Amycolatopsis rhabdoformis]|uniref:Cysteine synthase family protein n=1 Tax=Amycolatopsis rhabdoformis TaxID=1448059 RepID=A0ABZ1HV71_9PSEU|nr:cysteine synthase family protein [Amycolatopsis rhabdoformis]WSE26227.1 cysteine synthase family protein [Amycolatopsis rhabdoformis]
MNDSAIDATAVAVGTQVLPSVLDAIGQTPMVRLDRLTEGLSGTLVAKLEYLNPGGSKKDRVARRIIRAAEEAGTLRPGQPVVEVTSGNTGAGLAIACALTGHPFVAVLSAGSSAERARMIRALGAEVVLVEQAEGSVPGRVSGADMALVEDRARVLTEARGAFRSDQFENHHNVAAHYTGTGPEIWAQTGGRLDAFADYVGTGGGLAGITRALKERDPAIRCFAVEPAGAAALAGQDVVESHHPIQGGGFGRADLTHLRDVPLDGYLQVSGDEARRTARLLATREGIFAGFSAGANVAAALTLMREDFAGGTVAVVIPDTGLKYLSTDLWE